MAAFFLFALEIGRKEDKYEMMNLVVLNSNFSYLCFGSELFIDTNMTDLRITEFSKDEYKEIQQQVCRSI